MALAVLSPWPAVTAVVARQAARDCLRGTLGLTGETGSPVTDGDIDRIGEAIAAMIEKYAAAAPQALKNEAAIRVGGWLLEAPAASIRGQTIGPMTNEYAAGQYGAMLHSGAKSMLYPWRTKTAGVAK